jgi:hypothetical protein
VSPRRGFGDCGRRSVGLSVRGYDESASETRITPAKLRIVSAMMTKGTVYRVYLVTTAAIFCILSASMPNILPTKRVNKPATFNVRREMHLRHVGCIPLVLASTVLLPTLVYSKEALTDQLAINHKKQKKDASRAVWIVVRGASEGWSPFNAPSVSARSTSDGLPERASCVRHSALLSI